jgi:hypothetical protein
VEVAGVLAGSVGVEDAEDGEGEVAAVVAKGAIIDRGNGLRDVWDEREFFVEADEAWEELSLDGDRFGGETAGGVQSGEGRF